MLTWQHCEHVKLCKPPYARVGGICVTHKNRVFCKKTESLFVGCCQTHWHERITKRCKLQTQWSHCYSGKHYRIPHGLLVWCHRGRVGFEKHSNVKGKMFYFINCWVTESNLANKTVFPTPVFTKETHTALEAGKTKFIAFHQVGRYKTKNKVPIIFCGKL